MNAGGDGDRGYRTLAAAFKMAAGETPERRQKQAQLKMERHCVREQQHGSRRNGSSENRLPSMTNETYEEWVEPCARPRRWIDGPGYTASATVLARKILVQKYKDGRWCRVALYKAPRVRRQSDVGGL